MPLFKMQIFKRIGSQGKEWSNIYHIRETDVFNAASFVPTISGAEIGVHKNNVYFIRARISSEEEGDNVYTTVPINLFGAVPIAAQQLPIWDVARVDFVVPGGRPSYKYLRLPLGELDQADAVLSSGLIGDLQTNYINPLLGLVPATPLETGLVDEDGNAFADAFVFQNVQMRQTYRRKTKKASGGLSGS